MNRGFIIGEKIRIKESAGNKYDITKAGWIGYVVDVRPHFIVVCKDKLWMKEGWVVYAEDIESVDDTDDTDDEDDEITEAEHEAISGLLSSLLSTLGSETSPETIIPSPIIKKGAVNPPKTSVIPELPKRPIEEFSNAELIAEINRRTGVLA